MVEPFLCCNVFQFIPKSLIVPSSIYISDEDKGKQSLWLSANDKKSAWRKDNEKKSNGWTTPVETQGWKTISFSVGSDFVDRNKIGSTKPIRGYGSTKSSTSSNYGRGYGLTNASRSSHSRSSYGSTNLSRSNDYRRDVGSTNASRRGYSFDNNHRDRSYGNCPRYFVNVRGSTTSRSNKRSYANCTGSTSEKCVGKKPRFSLEETRSAIEGMKKNNNGTYSDHYMLGSERSSNGVELHSSDVVMVHTTIRPKDFRSYIRAPLNYGTFNNEKKNCHYRQIKQYVYENAKEDSIVEETDVIVFLASLGVTKAEFPTLSCFSVNSFFTLIVRITYASLCLVHRIPLKRRNKPGTKGDSWLNQLSNKEQNMVTDRINQFHSKKYVKKNRSYYVIDDKVSKEETGSTNSLSKNSSKAKDGSTNLPSPNPSETEGSENTQFKRRLHGFIVSLSKIRSDDWKNAFESQLQLMGCTIFEKSLPDAFKSFGGHYLLSEMEANRDYALKEALATYREIMSSKKNLQFEIDSYDGDDPYLQGNLMNRYMSDDDDVDLGGRQYGLTRVSLKEPDLITIVENVVQNDYCWDNV